MDSRNHRASRIALFYWRPHPKKCLSSRFSLEPHRPAILVPVHPNCRTVSKGGQVLCNISSRISEDEDKHVHCHHKLRQGQANHTTTTFSQLIPLIAPWGNPDPTANKRRYQPPHYLRTKKRIYIYIVFIHTSIYGSIYEASLLLLLGDGNSKSMVCARVTRITASKPLSTTQRDSISRLVPGTSSASPWAFFKVFMRSHRNPCPCSSSHSVTWANGVPTSNLRNSPGSTVWPESFDQRRRGSWCIYRMQTRTSSCGRRFPFHTMPVKVGSSRRNNGPSAITCRSFTWWQGGILENKACPRRSWNVPCCRPRRWLPISDSMICRQACQSRIQGIQPRSSSTRPQTAPIWAKLMRTGFMMWSFQKSEPYESSHMRAFISSQRHTHTHTHIIYTKALAKKTKNIVAGKQEQ